MNKKRIIFFSLLSFFLLSASFVFALEVDYPSLPGLPAPTDSSSLPQLTNYWFKFLIIVSGFIAMTSLILGGVRYFFSTGDPGKMTSAKEQISNAFMGLLILLSSYLILKTIDPKFVEIEDIKVEPIQTIDVPEASNMPTSDFVSLITAELPFGKIIEEKLLETKEVLPENEQRKSRMDRIKEVGTNSVSLAEKLKEQSDELKKLSEKCSCSQSEPCCENPNPGKGCKDNLCVSKSGCTCDPCKPVRDKIQEKEKENLKALYIGTKIKGTDEKGKEKEITTSIRQEQEKAEEEIRLIKEELGKLETAELFMINCPPWHMANLAALLDTKDFYLQKRWMFEISRIWPKIIVGDDWATLYCNVSGTIWEGQSVLESSSNSRTAEIQKYIPPPSLSNVDDPIPCTTEISLGEIIDRAKRVGYKLIERLEKLISLNEQLTKSVNDLHVLISQCSSQGPSSDPKRSGCFSVCQKTGLGSCIKKCTGADPCPSDAIEKKIKEIDEIIKGKPDKPAENEEKKEKEGIKDVVEGKKKTKEEAIEDKERREQVGIIPIAGDVVTEILKELSLLVRNKSRDCVRGYSGTSKLLDCFSIINSMGPDGKINKFCCYAEDWYQGCLAQCYLEGPESKDSDTSGTNEKDKKSKEQTEHKKCMNKCLTKVAKEKKIEDIATCRNALNFFCCTFEQK